MIRSCWRRSRCAVQRMALVQRTATEITVPKLAAKMGVDAELGFYRVRLICEQEGPGYQEGRRGCVPRQLPPVMASTASGPDDARCESCQGQVQMLLGAAEPRTRYGPPHRVHHVENCSNAVSLRPGAGRLGRRGRVAARLLPRLCCAPGRLPPPQLRMSSAARIVADRQSAASTTPRHATNEREGQVAFAKDIRYATMSPTAVDGDRAREGPPMIRSPAAR